MISLSIEKYKKIFDFQSKKIEQIDSNAFWFKQCLFIYPFIIQL